MVALVNLPNLEVHRPRAELRVAWVCHTLLNGTIN